jgi:hypothetical protein
LKVSDAKELQEELRKRKAVVPLLRKIMPNATEDDLIRAAAAVVDGSVKFEDLVPKAPPKAVKPTIKTRTTMRDGVEYGQDFDVHTQQPVGEEYVSKELEVDDTDTGIPWVKAPGEIKVKASLISSASNLMERAIPELFDEEGRFNNIAASTPKSAANIAIADMTEGLTQVLRSVSGAAIPETEITREVTSMVPTLTDTDAQARAKLARARTKINSLYSGLTTGYTGMPDVLGLGSMELPGSSSVKRYPTREAAQAAYESGELKQGDQVEIGE